MSDAGIKGMFIQQETEQQKEPGQGNETAGAQLAELRNAMGWSVEQVAEQLKLAPRQIIAIEANDFAALPGMTIARGFIRVYAKLMKIDAGPLLAMIPGEKVDTAVLPTVRTELSAPFSEARMPSMYRGGGSSKSLIGKGLLFLLLIAVLTIFALGWKPALLDSISAQIDKQKTFLTAPGVVAGKKTQTGADTGPNPPVVASAGVLEPIPVPAEPNVMVSTPSVPAAVVASLDASQVKKNDALVLKLHEDSWIQIKRSDGSMLVSRLLKAGVTESFDITEPVLLTVGNVAGVDATLRGVALNIKPKNNSNTVRLKLE
jgi:cytoskeleton protein RodZ